MSQSQETVPGVQLPAGSYWVPESMSPAPEALDMVQLLHLPRVVFNPKSAVWSHTPTPVEDPAPQPKDGGPTAALPPRGQP